VQLGLIPAYRTVSFGPGWWSYSFPLAATTTNAILWLNVEHAQHADAWTYLLLTAVTTFIGYLAVRTLIRLLHHDFLPRPSLVAVQSTGQPD
jgi:tellurite resistance protein